VVPRARHLLAAASAAVVLRVVVACSTSAEPAASPEAGPPGEAFTACEIQGYVSESEAGLCPDGTCPALAFDTNGARVPCCTSVVSGPGQCVDAAEPGLPDGSEAAAEAGEASDAVEAGADDAAEAEVESGAPEASTPPDAADAE